MINSLALLSLIIGIPLFGMVFALIAKGDENFGGKNSSDVAIFTIITNIFMIWRIFMVIDEENLSLQLFENISWLSVPPVSLVFAVDNISLLMILAVHLIVLMGIIAVRNELQAGLKTLMVYTLLFLSLSTGFFVSANIFSFYIFFAAMLVPLFMLLGIFGELKKAERLNIFLIYNIIGAGLVFTAVLLIYKYYGNINLNNKDIIQWQQNKGMLIYGLLALGIISRIPIWPFHYFISSISARVHNPLVFILISLLPLSSIYALLRFWPTEIPDFISRQFIWVHIIGTVTILFISLISLINRDSQYKIFAFINVYYILYLLGIFIREQLILQSIGYALFGLLIIFGGLEIVSAYIYSQEKIHESYSSGFLCRAKRLSLVYSFLTFAAIGFPISSMFTNNFLILSKISSANIQIGTFLMFSCLIVSASLIKEMFRLKTDDKESSLGKDDDLPLGQFVFMMFVIFVLMMSFIRPLWFVIDE